MSASFDVRTARGRRLRPVLRRPRAGVRRARRPSAPTGSSSSPSTPDVDQLRRVPVRPAARRAAGDPGGAVRPRPFGADGRHRGRGRPTRRHRGDGVARHAARARDRHGCGRRASSVSSLHPASTRAYRSAGWELGGPRRLARGPDPQLRGHPRRRRGRAGRAARPDRRPRGPCLLRPLGPGRARRGRPLAGVLVAPRAGRPRGRGVPLRRADRRRAHRLRRVHPDTRRRSWGYGLRIDDVCAHDRASAVALWRFIGGHSMQVERVQLPVVRVARAVVPPRRAGRGHRAREPLDAPASSTSPARSRRAAFPPGSSGSVTFGVSDPLTPGVVAAWTPHGRGRTRHRGRGGPGRRRGHPRRRRPQRARDRWLDVELLGRAGRVTGTEDGRRAAGRSAADAGAGHHRRLLTDRRQEIWARERRARSRARRGRDQAPFGAVEVAGDGRVLGVAVAVGDGHEPARRLLQRRAQGAELGVIGRGGHRPSLTTGLGPSQLVRVPTDPTGTIARCSSGSTSATRARTSRIGSATGHVRPTTSP